MSRVDRDYLYGSVECPHPRCKGDLYLNWSTSAPISPSDLDDKGGALTPGDCITSRWEVGCTEGHAHLVLSDEIHGDADDHPFGRQDWLYVATIIERLRGQS